MGRLVAVLALSLLVGTLYRSSTGTVSCVSQFRFDWLMVLRLEHLRYVMLRHLVSNGLLMFSF